MQLEIEISNEDDETYQSLGAGQKKKIWLLHQFEMPLNWKQV